MELYVTICIIFVCAGSITAIVRVDDEFILYADGVQIGTGTGWENHFTFSLPDDTTVMAVYIYNRVCMTLHFGEKKS